MSINKQGGLAGVIAGETEICSVNNDAVGLTYRGYAIQDLAEKASFEEVAFLLIYGKLPTERELKNYKDRLISLRQLPKSLLSMLKLLPPTAHPMDILRTSCSFLGCIAQEEQLQTLSNTADRLVACLPTLLLYWYRYHYHHKDNLIGAHDLTTAEYFLHLLHNEKPDLLKVQALNASLILYAEHEFNASTFASRVTAATLSDVYSSITSAIGTLKGPLHGGANEEAIKLIHSFKQPEDVENHLKKMLKEKKLIMGFGHRVYTKFDPRSDIIKVWAKKLAKGTNDKNLYAIAEKIEFVMRKEKNLFPNLDFYSALVYQFCNIPIFLFTPLFVLSRVTGWLAHVIEQRTNNKLIRPLAKYVGPAARPYLDINQRGN